MVRRLALLLACTSWTLSGCADPGGGAAADAADGSDPGATDTGDPTDASVGDGSSGDAATADASGPPRPGFRFPIHADDRALIRRAPIFHFDHDPAEVNRAVCTNYAGAGFPSCYDGHDGTDFLLDGAFFAMDNGSARVVAAEPGEVVAAVDGNYDRCHGDFDTGDVDCDGNPVRANNVVLRHPDGRETRYWHLKRDSVAVAVGDPVDCGDVLGLVGSSGYSTVPHLHFEVTVDGQTVDPFSVDASLWRDQDAGDGLPTDACR